MHPGSATEVLCDLVQGLAPLGPTSFRSWLREQVWLLRLVFPLAGWVTLAKLTPPGLSLFYPQNGMPGRFMRRLLISRCFCGFLSPSPPFLCSEEELCHPTGQAMGGFRRVNVSLSSMSSCAGQDQARHWVCVLPIPIPCPQAGSSMPWMHRAVCPRCRSQPPAHRGLYSRSREKELRLTPHIAAAELTLFSE